LTDDSLVGKENSILRKKSPRLDVDSIEFIEGLIKFIEGLIARKIDF